MKSTRTMIWTLGLALTGGATLLNGGCASGDKPLADNSGKTLSTATGEQLTEEMFLGKWDLDGERTDKANGKDDVAEDVTNDVLGKGWRFEKNGSLKTDMPVGWKTGTWKIEGKNTLVVDEGKGAKNFTASFKEGYLYVTKANGKILVFERDKFFGF